MGAEYLDYTNIRVAPYDFTINDMVITESLNNHSKLIITGIVPEETKCKYVEETQAPIEVFTVGDSETPLFKGIVTKPLQKAEGNLYNIKLEAMSYSYLTDIKKNSRTFQDLPMTYQNVLDTVMGGYGGGGVLPYVDTSKPIGEFILQYKETEWVFIRRLASRFHVPLVPDSLIDAPAIYFGVPSRGSKGKLDRAKYTTHKDMEAYRRLKENHIPGLSESDFIRYKIRCAELMGMGDSMTLKGLTLRVMGLKREISKSALVNTYILSNDAGLQQKNLYNDPISGMSINGTIIDRKNDCVKLWFDIDHEQSKDKACWFYYSTNYTSGGSAGFYCMPEMNESSRVYFPSNKEAEGVAQSAVRQPFQEAKDRGNPDIKYLRTKAGKEVRLYPGGILIVAEDDKTFIDIKDLSEESDETIAIKVICKDHDIKFMTEKNLIFEAGENIGVSAGQKVKLAIDPEAATDISKGFEDAELTTYIRLDGESETVQINAKEVKTQD